MGRRPAAATAAAATTTRRRTGGPAAATKGGMAQRTRQPPARGNPTRAARSGTLTTGELASGIVASVAGSAEQHFGPGWGQLGEQGQAKVYAGAERRVARQLDKGLPEVAAGHMTARELAKGAVTAALAALEPHLGPAWPVQTKVRGNITTNVADRINRALPKLAAGAAT